MKKVRIIVLVISAVVILGIAMLAINSYPKLTLVTGYTAKNLASSYFIAGRSIEFTQEVEHDLPPLSFSKPAMDANQPQVYATVFGQKKRTAVFRPGLGAVLLPEGKETAPLTPVPNRNMVPSDLAYPYGPAPAPDTVFPEVDYEQLQEAVDWAFEKPDMRKTRAVLVLYQDRIIAEKYAPGYDQSSPFLGWSMNKSILATLYGILQYRGKIDIQDPAPVAEWQNDERQRITLHHLLQMSSGLEWDERYDDICDATIMLFEAEDMSKAQMEKPAAYPPGSHWNYSSGTSNLLSGILRDQFPTHQAYLDFPYSALIDRIGMSSMILETDMAGNYVFSSYGWATARDWAKFGLLYLHEGVWQEDTLFDAAWVDYVTTPVPNSNGRYGAHFWLNAEGYLPDVSRNFFKASGYLGQRVAVFPEKEMVVVRFGLAEAPFFDFNEFFSGIEAAFPASQ